MHPSAEEALIDLFAHVADACDGDERLPKHVRKAYEKAMSNKYVAKLYDDMVGEQLQKLEKMDL